MNVLVVSPHRDDAAFSLGLTIASWIETGHTVTVLNCFTRSAWAPYSDAVTLHPNDRTSFVTALRRREDLAWKKQLGAGLQFHDLDLFDAPLRLACAVPEVFTAEFRPGDRALARIAGAIRKLARNAVAMCAPLSLGSHIDHRLARAATIDALRSPGPALAFYEDLPYAAEGNALHRGSLSLDAGEELSPVFPGPPLADVTAAVRRKARFAESYDSQIDSSVVAAIADHSRQYAGRERLWATPAWLVSPLAQGSEAWA